MKKLTVIWIVVIICIPLLEACGQSDPGADYQTYIYGQLTVDPELDSTRDNSEIDLQIVTANLLEDRVDTVYHAQTDRDGNYSGVAEFSQRGLYTLTVSRYGNELVSARLVLADGDSIRLDGVLPQINETAEIHSVENEQLAAYNRLERGVARLFGFADSGVVSADTLEYELSRWSDLMWDFYSENSRLYAGERAAISSVSLLEGIDDSLMMERIDGLVDSSSVFVPIAARLGTRYHSWYNDPGAVVSWLEGLSTREMEPLIRMELEMSRIGFLYNNAMTDEALFYLDQFTETFSDSDQALSWASGFRYNLTNLAPGMPLPDFSVTTMSGEIVSNESLLGTPYLLELSTLDNELYQDQFDQGMGIYHIYRNFGVQFLSIPLQATQVMTEAYFEEFPEDWMVASPETVDTGEFIQRYNAQTVPVRIIVDREGNIVRKYERADLEEVIDGLGTLFNNEEDS